MKFTTATRWMLLAALLPAATWATLRTSGAAPIAPHGVQEAPGLARRPETPPPDDGRSARIKQLDAQIKALRDQHKADVEPLQAQIKALNDKFQQQLDALQAQRLELVEEGAPGLKELDEQETADLNALAAREKDEVDKVHARYNDERKAIRDRYQQRRRELESGRK